MLKAGGVTTRWLKTNTAVTKEADEGEKKTRTSTAVTPSGEL